MQPQGLRCSWQSKMMETRMLSLNEARTMICAAEDEALRLGCVVNIAVLDGGGHVIAQIRMDGALLAGVNDAANKAYTACAFAIATRDLAGFARTAEERAGVSHSNEIGRASCRERV